MSSSSAPEPEPAASRLAELRTRFAAVHGHWDARFDAVFDLDPGFLERYVALAETAWNDGPLSETDRHLVLLARDAAVTYRNEAALRSSMRAALAAGVERAAIVEVLELVSVLGVHALNAGLPIALAEYPEHPEHADAAADRADPAVAAERQRLRERFRQVRGYWAPGWEDTLRHATGFFAEYVEFSGWAARSGALSPKSRELVYIAIDAACTHLFDPGTSIHVANARRHGAELGEVVQVLQLLALMGIESCALGMPMLRELAETGRD